MDIFQIIGQQPDWWGYIFSTELYHVFVVPPTTISYNVYHFLCNVILFMIITSRKIQWSVLNVQVCWVEYYHHKFFTHNNFFLCLVYIYLINRMFKVIYPCLLTYLGLITKNSTAKIRNLNEPHWTAQNNNNKGFIFRIWLHRY